MTHATGVNVPSRIVAAVMAAGLGLVTPHAASGQSKPQSTTATPARSTPKQTYTANSAAARRAQAARSRALSRARQLLDVQTPRFRVDESGHEVPDVRAEAAIIYDPQTNEVLWASNAEAERSIASITKVMTALVFLESGVEGAREVTVQRADVSRASTTYLAAGYKVTSDDLLHLLLIGSDNAAARALARISPYGSAGFIDRMNEKASMLGLTTTHYEDPSGLLAANVSSAHDMARLIAYAAADERIGGIMRKSSYVMRVGKRTVTVSSTNELVKTGDIDVVGGKTGFINRSGYCLATLLRLPQTNHPVAVVVLGAKSNPARFWETRHLFNWFATRAKAAMGAADSHQPQQ